MSGYKILLIEDDKVHLNNTKDGLEEEYGHAVQAFRDISSLMKDDRDKKIIRPDLVIIDIILAETLKEGEPHAPVWDKSTAIPEDQKPYYRDDRLGLDLGHGIRSGKLQCIEKMTPLLFLTCRLNEDIISEINELKNSLHLAKPVFIKTVNEAIIKLMERVNG